MLRLATGLASASLIMANLGNESISDGPKAKSTTDKAMRLTLGRDSPIIQIVSGITHPGDELCLQIQNGEVGPDVPVVLDSCLESIAAGDGRELFKFNSRGQLISMRPGVDRGVCIGLENNDATEGGRIITMECGEAASIDGRSFFQINGDGQVHVNPTQGNYCLTQFGDKAGLKNVAKSASVEVSDALRATFGGSKPALAVNGDIHSVWESASFTLEKPKRGYMVMDLGEMYPLKSIRIDWKRPAVSYSVQVSEDGENWMLLHSTDSNPLLTTENSLSYTKAQYVRIELKRPHPELALLGYNSYQYAIKNVSIFVNRLRTGVETCTHSDEALDARDRYFLSYVGPQDLSHALELRKAGGDLRNQMTQIEEQMAHLSSLTDSAKLCNQESKEFLASAREMDQTLADLEAAVMADMSTRGDTTNPLDLIGGLSTQGESEIEDVDGSALNMDTSPGDTRWNPAEDCFAIKNRQEASSGYYWIQPRCAGHPARVFCDMQSKQSVYVWNSDSGAEPGIVINRKVPSARDVELTCANHGMDPIVIREAAQLDSVKMALRAQGFSAPSAEGTFIPIAQSRPYADGKKKSRSITSYLNPFSSLDETEQLPIFDLAGLHEVTSAVGVEHEGDGDLIGFQVLPGGKLALRRGSFGLSKISAVLCSTNQIERQITVPLLSCDITAEQVLDGKLTPSSGTPQEMAMLQEIQAKLQSVHPDQASVTIRCDRSCSQLDRLPNGAHRTRHDGTLPNGAKVIGSSTYRDDSSVCYAALHEGILHKNGLLTVRSLGALARFDGSVANGVRSESYSKSVWPRGFSLSPAKESCPIHRVTEAIKQAQLNGVGSSNIINPSDLFVSDNGIAGAGSAHPLDHVSFAALKQESTEGNWQSLFEDADEDSAFGTSYQTRETLKRIDRLCTAVDFGTVESVALEARRVISDVRGDVKPALVNQKSLRDELGDLQLFVDETVTSLRQKGSSLTARSRGLKQNVVDTTRRARLADGYKDWYLPTGSAAARLLDIERDFEKFDHPLATPSSQWRVLKNAFDNGASPIGQLSSISPRSEKDSAVGGYLFVKNKNFFDFTMYTEILFDGRGSAGVAFRVKDKDNFMLFEVRSALLGGKAAIYSIHRGRAIQMATADFEGGFTQGLWYRAEITAFGGDISIRFQKLPDLEELAALAQNKRKERLAASTPAAMSVAKKTRKEPSAEAAELPVIPTSSKGLPQQATASFMQSASAKFLFWGSNDEEEKPSTVLRGVDAVLGGTWEEQNPDDSVYTISASVPWHHSRRGTVGFFSAGMNSVFFDAVSVRAKKCKDAV